MNEMTVRVPSDDIANLIAFLVIGGDLAKESAVKHLGMPLNDFESWLDTWQFIRDCLDEGKEEE